MQEVPSSKPLPFNLHPAGGDRSESMSLDSSTSSSLSSSRLLRSFEHLREWARTSTHLLVNTRLGRSVGNGAWKLMRLSTGKNIGCPKIRRVVVAKSLVPLDGGPEAKAQERAFNKEAALLDLINRDGAKTGLVRSFGSYDSGRTLVFDFYNGGTLEDAIDKGKVTPEDAMLIVKKLTKGLLTLHEMGLAHRDIHTENVLLRVDGKGKVTDAVLADLGLGINLANLKKQGPMTWNWEIYPQETRDHGEIIHSLKKRSKRAAQLNTDMVVSTDLFSFGRMIRRLLKPNDITTGLVDEMLKQSYKERAPIQHVWAVVSKLDVDSFGLVPEGAHHRHVSPVASPEHSEDGVEASGSTSVSSTESTDSDLSEDSDMD